MSLGRWGTPRVDVLRSPLVALGLACNGRRLRPGVGSRLRCLLPLPLFTRNSWLRLGLRLRNLSWCLGLSLGLGLGWLRSNLRCGRHRLVRPRHIAIVRPLLELHGSN